MFTHEKLQSGGDDFGVDGGQGCVEIGGEDVSVDVDGCNRYYWSFSEDGSIDGVKVRFLQYYF